MVALALFAGVAAALGSVVGKFTFTQDVTPIDALITTLCPAAAQPQLCKWAPYAGRALLFPLLAAFNSLGLACYVAAMQRSDSFTATVLNTAANFTATALLGMLVFGEVLSLMWWCGAAMIFAGVVLLTSNKAAEQGGAQGAVEGATKEKSA